MSNVANLPEPKQSTLIAKFASKYSIDSEKLLPILKNTAFKVKEGEVSNEQMAALLVVADQYGLNPFTKEIFAFPDKGGIVPVVGVDGWSRIINDHPGFDGMDFEQDDQKCTCIIYRKDRSHPIKVTEYLSECKRGTQPWSSHPKRMLRHKAMIQCARIAFGFGGIYDQDEAERIVERDVTAESQIVNERHAEKGEAILPLYLDADFDKNMPAWTKLIESSKETADNIIKKVSSRAVLSAEQQKKLRDVKPKAPEVTYAQVADKLNAAKSADLLDAEADLIREVKNEAQRDELTVLYHKLKEGFAQ